MNKTLRLLFVFGLIFFISCEDLIDELIGPTVYLWGEDYSIKNTTRLDLFGLTGSIPPRIGDLTNLEYLELSGNLSGGIPPEIGDLTNLIHLDLRGNQLTGSIPSQIGNLTNLRILYLHDNQLTGEIPESMCNVFNYSNSFTFQRNQLCPPYPSCFINYIGEQDVSNCWDCEEDGIVELWGKCYSIEYTTGLYLSNSGLTGSIPSEIGYLTNLTNLHLNDNQLTGEIPSEISNLINLRLLDLSNNQLSGFIPNEICSFNLTWYITYFSWNPIPTSSVSNNQLCPPYPSCLQGNYTIDQFGGQYTYTIIGDQNTSDCD